jgi:hypothetical protein
VAREPADSRRDNALNHTQYTSVATNLSGIGFGGVAGMASERVVQLKN